MLSLNLIDRNNVINQSGLNRHNAEPLEYDIFKAGTTIDCEYVPFYSQFTKKNITDDVFMYYKPKHSTHGYYNTSKYDKLFYALNNSMMTYKYRFFVGDSDHEVKVNKGYITDADYNILLMIGINEYFEGVNLYNSEYVDNYSNIKPENYGRFKLFLSTELMSNPIYKNLWKKLNSVYVSEFYKREIPVEFTTAKRMNTLFFSDGFDVKFNNITELSHHLHNDVIEIWRADVSYVEPIPEPVVDQLFAEQPALTYTEDSSGVTIDMSDVPQASTNLWTDVGGGSDGTELHTTSEMAFTVGGSETVIQAENTVFDNVTMQGDVRIEGSGNTIRNSIIGGVDSIDSSNTFIGNTIRSQPDGANEIVHVEEDPIFDDPNTVHVTPSIDLVDDTVEPIIQDMISLQEQSNTDMMMAQGLAEQDRVRTSDEARADRLRSWEAPLRVFVDGIEQESELAEDDSDTEMERDVINDEARQQEEDEIEDMLVAHSNVEDAYQGEDDVETVTDQGVTNQVINVPQSEINAMEEEAREFFGDDEIDNDEQVNN